MGRSQQKENEVSTRYAISRLELVYSQVREQGRVMRLHYITETYHWEIVER